jgi:hypothetical protein
VAFLHADTNEDLVLLVETEARWYSQIAGRFRWTVSVDLSLGEVGAPEESVHQHFEVPVALLFDHQREADAINEATSVIQRRLGELMDLWLQGKGA